MHDPTTLAFLAALAGGAIYLGHVALWPYRPCPACHGTGHQTSPLNPRAARPCHACGGQRLRPRLAYRLYRNHRDHKENQR
ncbi:hypothetical protein [Saccharopolyspora sp. 6V]|uniref:hypothetical protein n=1 Tax=Saccharopolyspora sp. 6V TaxID=2877239 RepID=UPI001CD389B3|nr:hypothetical protein [Saccharopolyspora sp. 6V]MCA1194164.1 hypothetical protein [Saccharopolyspora sp. 6V]